MSRHDATVIRRVVACSALATVLVGLATLLTVARNGLGLPDLLMPGRFGPSAHVIQRDLPGARLQPTVGSDGQQFYAIARNPVHLREVAPELDRPRYRAQRILLPVLAWALHPSGGGRGLIVALLAVNLAGVAVGSGAVAFLAARSGRSPWWGLVFAGAPGTIMSVRMSVPDALALALALAAFVALLRGRPVLAAVAAAAAVLAKESTLLVLAGLAVYPMPGARPRLRALVVVPALVASAWALALFRLLPHIRGTQYTELGLPFLGLARAASYWVHAPDLGAAIGVLSGLALAIGALARCPRGPYRAALVVQLVFLVFLSRATFQYFVSGPRTVLPVTILGALALLEPAPVEG